MTKFTYGPTQGVQGVSSVTKTMRSPLLSTSVLHKVYCVVTFQDRSEHRLWVVSCFCSVSNSICRSDINVQAYSYILTLLSFPLICF